MRDDVDDIVSEDGRIPGLFQRSKQTPSQKYDETLVKSFSFTCITFQFSRKGLPTCILAADKELSGILLQKEFVCIIQNEWRDSRFLYMCILHDYNYETHHISILRSYLLLSNSVTSLMSLNNEISCHFDKEPFRWNISCCWNKSFIRQLSLQFTLVYCILRGLIYNLGFLRIFMTAWVISVESFVSGNCQKPTHQFPYLVVFVTYV